jgi:hypothetical protein
VCVRRIKTEVSHSVQGMVAGPGRDNQAE